MTDKEIELLNEGKQAIKNFPDDEIEADEIESDEVSEEVVMEAKRLTQHND